MKNGFRILVSLLLVLSLTVSAALASDFTGLKWGMSREEVTELLGKETESDTAGENNVIVRYFNREIKGFSSLLILLFNSDNALFAECHGLVGAGDLSRYDVLAESCEKEYGEPIDNPRAVIECFDLMLGIKLDEEMIAQGSTSGFISYKCWKESSDTDVVLVHLKAADSEATLLVYCRSTDQ